MPTEEYRGFAGQILILMAFVAAYLYSYMRILYNEGM
jgi:hypothetical protein